MDLSTPHAAPHASKASILAESLHEHALQDIPSWQPEDPFECSSSSSRASAWSLCPSDFITTQAPEFSRISFVVDALSEDMQIQRITFDFAIGSETDSKLSGSPQVA